MTILQINAVDGGQLYYDAESDHTGANLLRVGDYLVHVIGDEPSLDDVKALLPVSAPTVDDVWAEKDRRWNAGFVYTFPDDRGARHIGTTPTDMLGWQEVSTLAQAAIALGAPTTNIYIDTDSGGVNVTAQEWQSIVIAAAQFRQPIFQAACNIVSMNPIPADFRDDKYWVTT